MQLTQKDYDERVARQAAGNGTDEDRRLIAHYEANGFNGDDNSAGKRQEAGSEQPAQADDTARPTQEGDVKPAKGAPATVRNARNQG